MAQFSVNASRFDPYKNFKFRVKWDGAYVAGISKVSALKRTTEVIEHRDGERAERARQVVGHTAGRGIERLVGMAACGGRGNHPAIDRHHGLDQPTDSRGGFGVAENGF